ncbi:MAG: glycosyltransferase family 1 protein [Deltaproteobacteria bacterium]|nr:glycosyltransferase family 1 protein [Deltaproteobacteria bacterium]
MTSHLAPCLSDARAHRGDDIAARLPRELAPLARLAFNVWWSWQPRAGEVFREIDPVRWEASGRNPVKTLRDTSAACLATAARNEALVARVRALDAALERDLSRPFSWPEVATVERPIAFFCAEYGLHASLPIYSGGLGVLAGDWLKEASDSGLPMVAVGLYYRRGFFRQRLDRSGWQHEHWTESTAEELPLQLELDGAGAPRVVRVEIRGRQVAACIWHVHVGRVPLFLLDTNLPENDPISRFISSTLYVGDREFRLMQYAMLAMGGVRVLRAMGIDPSVIHLNEGHAALAALELVREGRVSGLRFEDALASARGRVVFTTHTPVPAGNEHYDVAQIDEVLGSLPAELRVDRDQLLALGRPRLDDGPAAPFGVTELALRMSRSANGVSRKHGEIARGMWQHLWPGRGAQEVPISHVTNGVHVPTWMAEPMRALLDRHLGSGWEVRDDAAAWARLDDVPDEELWAVRTELRAHLVEYVRTKSITDRLVRGESIAYAEGAASTFDPSVLTVGFARRVAAYKRLHLLIQDPVRALALLRGPRRIQVVIAGKAHPMDDGAKQAVQRIFAMKDVEYAATHVVFLEDYDLGTAAQLVAGCDLWVNLPRPPLEASGTSGMKAGLNGSINLSVLDGFWAEAFEEGQNGWAIASEGADEGAQDARDAAALYGLLENEVVPAFYDRDAQGIPRAWIRRMRASLRTMATRFSARRMLRDYVERVYRT